MKLTMEDDKTIFIGQQIVYYGNPMSKTIEGLPKERMIETSVMEETQMGMIWDWSHDQVIKLLHFIQDGIF